MYFGGTGPHMVSERKRAAPTRRRHRSFERGQQRLGVAVGNGQHRNLRDGLGLAQRQPHGFRCGAHARGQWVARINRHVHHTAALYAVARTPGALRKNLTREIAVLMRIRVNDAAYSAMFGGHFWLDAAPGCAIACNHDCAFHGNPKPFELLVVIRNAVVDIDQRRGDVAIHGIGVICGKLFALLV